MESNHEDIGDSFPMDAFERSIKVYPDAQTLDGIGDAVVWSAERNQLTAVVDGRLYHVHLIHHDSEEDKEFALKILEAITG